MIKFLHQLWSDDSGQDIAEYAVMLAVILVIVVGTIRLIGSNANTVFSQVGSAIDHHAHHHLSDLRLDSHIPLCDEGN